ncbi:MAG: TIM barrel protein [Chloroflexia bacterium]
MLNPSSNSNLPIGYTGRFFPGNWRPAREEIAFAHANNFRAIQFRGKEEGLGELHLGDPVSVVAGALRASSVAAVLEIMGPLTFDGRTESGMSPLDLLIANLPAIHALPCPYVHLHLHMTHHPVDQTDRERIYALEDSIIPQFVAAVGLAKQHNFAFGFEHNDPDSILFANPARCLRALNQVPGLRFVWDFNHTHPDDLAGFRALATHLSILHISDTPLPAVNHHLPLGRGTVDLASNIRICLAANFSGPAILEIGGLAKTSGLGHDTDQALIQSADLLNTILANTKKEAPC